MTDDADPLLKLEKVAELLDTTLDFVYELTSPNTRVLPVVYIGPRSPRVRMSDLQTFIAARTVAAKPTTQEQE